MESQQRQDALRALLQERPYDSQQALLAALLEAGIEVSQPALSRDLRSLGVAKIRGRYRWLEEERVTPLEKLKSLLRGWSPVTCLRLVNCEPGSASAIARALEAEDLEGFVGTVAGDDSILVALKNEDAAGALEARLDSLLKG